MFVLMCGSGSLHAQTRKKTSVAAPPKIEDLPCFPIDTIATADSETKIILYSNNTWKYHRPSLSRLNALDVYTQHWDTTQVFAYRTIELRDLPAVVDLKLIESLNDFSSPIKGKISSRYGPRGRRNHNGIDIPLKTGDPIYAAFDGKVRYSKYNTGGFGNLVILRHENGLETWHAHLSRANVRSGDYVKAGQIIGYGGSTGRSRSPHLHFEVRYCDQTFDPEFLIDFESGNLRYQTFALQKTFFNIHSRATDYLDEDDPLDTFALALNDAGDLTSEEKTDAKPKPKTTVPQNKAVYHTVKKDDMLSKLAGKYGVSVKQICQLNNITENTILRLGKSLRIK